MLSRPPRSSTNLFRWIRARAGGSEIHLSPPNDRLASSLRNRTRPCILKSCTRVRSWTRETFGSARAIRKSSNVEGGVRDKNNLHADPDRQPRSGRRLPLPEGYRAQQNHTWYPPVFVSCSSIFAPLPSSSFSCVLFPPSPNQHTSSLGVQFCLVVNYRKLFCSADHSNYRREIRPPQVTPSHSTSVYVPPRSGRPAQPSPLKCATHSSADPRICVEPRSRSVRECEVPATVKRSRYGRHFDPRPCPLQKSSGV